MSYTFSRRDFMKYSALTVVAVAGAGLLSGCEIQDPNNPVKNIGEAITLGTTKAQLTLAEENKLDGKFKIRLATSSSVGLEVIPSNFTVTVLKTNADGKEETFYASSPSVGSTSELKITDADDLSGNYSSDIAKGDDVTLTVTANGFSIPTEAGCSYTVLFKYVPYLYQPEYSMGWKITGNVENTSASEGDGNTDTDGE